ncbi:MAG: Lrp/AsnC ligand binding domain-containing protein [Acidobacteriota bacterium]
MRASAYVLVNVEAGMARAVMEKVSKLRDVSHVDAVLGPYDLIVSMTGTDFNEIGRAVIEKMQAIEGVERTLTCNVVSFEV